MLRRLRLLRYRSDMILKTLIWARIFSTFATGLMMESKKFTHSLQKIFFKLHLYLGVWSHLGAAVIL
ncbi:MAG: hypothetical protein CNLJKLNK_01206 [Holosporales bacterium]